MRPRKGAKLIASTIEKKRLVLVALRKISGVKRPRIKAGTYIRCFGKLIDISDMPEWMK